MRLDDLLGDIDTGVSDGDDARVHTGVPVHYEQTVTTKSAETRRSPLTYSEVRWGNNAQLASAIRTLILLPKRYTLHLESSSPYLIPYCLHLSP